MTTVTLFQLLINFQNFDNNDCFNFQEGHTKVCCLINEFCDFCSQWQRNTVTAGTLSLRCQLIGTKLN